MRLILMATEPLDFSRRTEPAELPEWMDEPCSYGDFHACLADLAQVNRLTLAHRPTLHWLDQLVQRQRPAEPTDRTDRSRRPRSIALFRPRRRVA